MSIAEPRRGRVFLGVSLVSLCVLVLQLALTRLFSATMYYHFAFLAISLALFGSGASGVFVYVLRGRLGPARDLRWLSVSAVLFALTTVFAVHVVLSNPLSPLDPPATTVSRLVRIYAAAALPFFCAGCAITLAVERYARQMSRLYLFDLVGAALGCLVLIPVLNALGAVNTALFVGVLATGAAGLFESARPAGRGPLAVVAVVAAGLVALLADNTATRRLEIRRAKGLVEKGNVIFSKWNSFSRVTVWGSLASDAVLIMIDADAATLLSRDASNLERHARQRDRVEALAYHLKRGSRALVIGPGGGNDVVMARLFGAREVTAVEVNPIIARDVMSSEPFRSYSGRLYEQPGVRLVVDEGRSFIRGSAGRYDVIQGTMVDTWAATAAGAFALTENNLYTVEAFKDYLTHLADDGILSMTRWYLEPPDQLLRLVCLARAAMGELGIDDPERHVILVRGAPEPGSQRAAATFLLKRSAFTDVEVQTVQGVANRNGYWTLYSPLVRPPNDFTRLMEASDPAEVWRSLPNDVAPPRDNNPFFFQTVRIGNLGQALSASGEWRKTNLGTFVLCVLLVLTTALTVVFILGPLALGRGRALSGGVAPRLPYLLYFACLGAGFILVEVALVQKCVLFLGHPVYSLAVVLFSLLVFSGIGSALSGRIREERLIPALVKTLLAVALLVGLYVAALSPIFYGLVQTERAYRIAVTVALLAPLGIVMGMPMPTGIRLLAIKAPEIIPWAWGVNGAASVMGSVAAVAIAIVAGFNQALLVATALYLLAIPLVARKGA